MKLIYHILEILYETANGPPHQYEHLTRHEKGLFVLSKTYSSPEDSGGGSEVERTASGVGIHSLLDELGIFNLVSGH